MLARTYIAYVAIAAIALVSMTSAAPAAPVAGNTVTLAAVAEEMEGPDFLPVPKIMFPMCCLHNIVACCISKN
ncbi:hypothetical protein EC991_008142 [Linnemannia zychae]|nr:hypothetical protein EC991_008142 [Linnemannia zychae]